MSTKTVYTFHPDTRAYLGPLELSAERGDMDPMEPGRWLIPGSCLEVAPSPAPEGRQAVAEAGAWVLRDITPPPVPPVVAPAPEPAPPTPAQLRQALVDDIQDYMDAMAQMLGYDDIKTAVTYAEEPAVPKFQAEGQALRAWRSLVWAACYAHPAFADEGADLPTREQAIALLPQFVSPAD